MYIVQSIVMLPSDGCLFCCSKGVIHPSDLEQDYGQDVDFLIARLKLLEGEKDVRIFHL